MDQPCPECDTESKRIVSRDFAAFIHREGYPRRIPDDGSYYHLGQKVSRPLTGGNGFHPELTPPDPIAPPSIAITAGGNKSATESFLEAATI